jgi:hypothetical protein
VLTDLGCKINKAMLQKAYSLINLDKNNINEQDMFEYFLKLDQLGLSL